MRRRRHQGQTRGEIGISLNARHAQESIAAQYSRRNAILPGKAAQFIELALSFLDLGFEAAMPASRQRLARPSPRRAE